MGRVDGSVAGAVAGGIVGAVVDIVGASVTAGAVVGRVVSPPVIGGIATQPASSVIKSSSTVTLLIILPSMSAASQEVHQTALPDPYYRAAPETLFWP